MNSEKTRHYKENQSNLIRATRVTYETSHTNPESTARKMSTNDVVWLNCRMDKGMFQDEFAVQIRLASGTEVSLFAHRSLVRKNGSDTTGYLRTNFVQEEQANATVLLPTESFETGNRWAMVPRKDLSLQPA